VSKVDNVKALRALDLRSLLDLPYHYHVQPNNVGSLSVFDRHPGEPGAVLVGYIDFAEDIFQLLVAGHERG
jgi:hypothetical protein